jgi:hypothetical protein
MKTMRRGLFIAFSSNLWMIVGFRFRHKKSLPSAINYSSRKKGNIVSAESNYK